MPLTKAVTKYGILRGVQGEEPTTTVFRAVPFAKPPVGELRFKRPVEPEAWEGERLCDKWPYAPIGEQKQYKAFGAESEDCLYMNIFTPAESKDDRLPVMVWFFGGGFIFGSICNRYTGEKKLGEGWTYTGEGLNKKGVILVTPNYRTGLLGFGAHHKLIERDGTAGNYGLWDQIQALRWVKENIAAFGGDPENVTIFGHSAGAASVKALIASGQTRGLFRRAIMESGSGMSGPERVHTPEWIADWVEKAMDDLGISFQDLLTMDGQELVGRIPQRIYEMYRGFEKGTPVPWQIRPSIFGPCNDGTALAQDPGIALYAGDYDPALDLMMGTVLLDNNQPIKACFDEVKDDPEILRTVAYSPSVAFGRRLVNAGRKPVYGYFIERNVPGPTKEFLSRTPQERKEIPFAERTGPYHGCEFPYIFGKMDFYAKEWTPWDYELQKILQSYWTNFAKTGNPNGEGLPDWPLFTRETPVVMNVRDDGCEARDVVDSEKADRIIRHFVTYPGYTETLKDYILTW